MKNKDLYFYVFISTIMFYAIMSIILYDYNIKKTDLYPKEVNGLISYLDQANQIQKDNQTFEVEKINYLYPGFFADKESRLEIKKYNKENNNNLRNGGIKSLYLTDLQKNSLKIISNGYNKNFCDTIKELSLEDPRKSNAVKIYNMFSEKGINTGSLVKYYKNMEYYDIKLNGKLITEKNIKCKKENNNMIEINKKI